MTPLFIGRYFISSSVSGKSFPLETVDTVIFIYSVHVTRGRLCDLSACEGKNTRNIFAFVTTEDGLFERVSVVYACVRARVGAAPTGDGLL